jgi:hypothetical protein
MLLAHNNLMMFTNRYRNPVRIVSRPTHQDIPARPEISSQPCFIANHDGFTHGITPIVSSAGLQGIGEFAREKDDLVYFSSKWKGQSARCHTHWDPPRTGAPVGSGAFGAARWLFAADKAPHPLGES